MAPAKFSASGTVLLLLSALLGPAPSSAQAQLTRWHYARTCPQVEATVLKHMAKAHAEDPGSTPALLRLFFHDCFVRGCDASILLKGTKNMEPEAAADPNLTLDGFDVIGEIKAELETACPGVVSCADILALAARDSVRLAKGPTIPLPLGRRDGLLSLKSQGNSIPSSHANSSTLLAQFQAKGLGVTDLVALSGAHTFGNGRCVRLVQRFPPNTDPNWNIPYRNLLMKECNSPDIVFDAQVVNDPVTPFTFDNQYFKNVLGGKGLFTSDAVLKDDPRTLPLVKRFAADTAAFNQQFARSLIRMSLIVVNPRGEIRKVCHKVNGV